jgi:hypothetical protein
VSKLRSGLNCVAYMLQSSHITPCGHEPRAHLSTHARQQRACHVQGTKHAQQHSVTTDEPLDEPPTIMPGQIVTLGIMVP